jgi:hypothetical protein
VAIVRIRGMSAIVAEHLTTTLAARDPVINLVISDFTALG